MSGMIEEATPRKITRFCIRNFGKNLLAVKAAAACPKAEAIIIVCDDVQVR